MGEGAPVSSHAAQDVGAVEKWIAPRWKAIAGFIVAAAGAATQAFPASTRVHAIAGGVTAIAVLLGVHQAPANVPLLALNIPAVEPEVTP